MIQDFENSFGSIIKIERDDSEVTMEDSNFKTINLCGGIIYSNT